MNKDYPVFIFFFIETMLFLSIFLSNCKNISNKCRKNIEIIESDFSSFHDVMVNMFATKGLVKIVEKAA